MRKILLRLIDAFGEMLTYFAILTYFMLAVIISKAIPKWGIVCILASFLIYLVKHYREKEENKDEK